MFQPNWTSSDAHGKNIDKSVAPEHGIEEEFLINLKDSKILAQMTH
jgi:hypothetical protein